jgi:S1-C subfamily serine protease
MRYILLFLVFCSCSCATVQNLDFGNEQFVSNLTASVVRFNVDFTVITREEGAKSGGYYGSGVVIGHTPAGHSLILTATHVGKIQIGRPLKNELPLKIVVALDMKVDGVKGTCPAHFVSEDDASDVSLVEADCIIGPVAPIATEMPTRGAPVMVIGHPNGFSVPIITTGWFSGLRSDNLEVISAATHSGNSGCPVFYNGKIVGILSMNGRL